PQTCSLNFPTWERHAVRVVWAWAGSPRCCGCHVPSARGELTAHAHTGGSCECACAAREGMVGVGDCPAPEDRSQDRPGVFVRGPGAGSAEAGRAGPVRAVRGVLPDPVRRRPAPAVPGACGEVTGLGYDGGYSSFTRGLRARGLRPRCERCAAARTPAEFAVIDHPAGEETQGDWIELPDPPPSWGRGKMAHLLVGALSCSGLWRGVLAESEEQPYLIVSLHGDSERIGGLTVRGFWAGVPGEGGGPAVRDRPAAGAKRANGRPDPPLAVRPHVHGVPPGIGGPDRVVRRGREVLRRRGRCVPVAPRVAQGRGGESQSFRRA